MTMGYYFGGPDLIIFNFAPIIAGSFPAVQAFGEINQEDIILGVISARPHRF
jgi:hypothetical protein